MNEKEIYFGAYEYELEDTAWLDSDLFKARQSENANLIIGLGGTGSIAIDAVRNELFANIEGCEKAENAEEVYPHVRFVYLDNDGAVLNEQSKKPLTKCIVLPQYQPETENITSPIKNMWIDKLTFTVADFCNINKERHVTVHLLSGLSGTVSSETFLQVAYSVQEVLQFKVGQDAESYGYFFIPTPGAEYISKKVADNMSLNTLRSILKLDYCMHLPENSAFWELSDPRDPYKKKRFTSSPVDQYCLIPIEYYYEKGRMEIQSAAQFIAQYFKEETSGIISQRKPNHNASAGSYMTLFRGTKVADFSRVTRKLCSARVRETLKELKTKKLPNVEEHWERAGISEEGFIQRFEQFCLADEMSLSVLAAEYSEGSYRPDAGFIEGVQKEFDRSTEIIIARLRAKANEFIRLELPEMIEKGILLYFEEDTGGNVYTFDRFVLNSCDLFMKKKVRGTQDSIQRLKIATSSHDEALEALIHANLFRRREKYKRYIAALANWKKAQIQAEEQIILNEYWAMAGDCLQNSNKDLVDPLAKAFEECLNGLFKIENFSLADSNKRNNRFSEVITSCYSSGFEEEFLTFIQRLEIACLNEKKLPANLDIVLTRIIVDEAARDTIQRIELENPQYVREFLGFEEPQEITWRKAEKGLITVSALYVYLPEERDFEEIELRQLRMKGDVVPVVTHRPGVAEYCGYRIHPTLFDDDMEFDYYHMLRIGNQDAAVYLRNEIVSRLFRSESVLEPEMTYVRKIKHLTVPDEAVDLEKVLSGFDMLSYLSVPAVRMIEKPDLLRMVPKIVSLKLTGEKTYGFKSLYLPENLKELDLSGMSLDDLPREVTDAKKLKQLNLTGTHFKTLGPHILDLSDRISFTLEKKSIGICISGIVIDDMDPAILLGPAASIREWYAMRGGSNAVNAMKGLNEVKVIFLGDGEAGKTRTIQRIIADGEQTVYKEGPTHGIAISDKIWRIGNREVKVHFWDFGGQEILYSMHRMFMTQQTVYVILLNARESTQEERAHYWLHNVVHFAGKDVPVILIINKIDTNSNAFINNKALEDMYPNIRGLTRLSNETFDRDAFRKAVIEPLESVIEGMPTLTDEFPAAWKNLAVQLAKSNKPYLREKDIRRMLKDTPMDRNTLFLLLKWFNQIGVSFFYGEKPDLSDFIVLKPAWVTNAIYIILTNGGRFGKENGILEREDIVSLLLDDNEMTIEADRKKEEIVRVNPDIHYHERSEAAFVLGLIRYFHLSFEIDDGKEFIPILCTRSSSKAVDAIVEDEGALHFKYIYRYLPRLILHRLMVELHLYLDLESVAGDEAVFSLKERGLSAAVLKKGEELHIYVRGSKDSDSPDIFLDMIREALGHINNAFDFKPGEYIVYRNNGKSEDFDYVRLLSQQRNSSIDTVYSVVFERDIYLSEILNPVNMQMIVWSEFKRDLITACLNLQNHAQSIFGDEVKCNVYICDQLKMSGRTAATEHLGGRSGSGTSSRYGERDIVIFDQDNREQFIVECQNVTYKSIRESDRKYLNKKDIESHLTKLLNQYNPNGLGCLCLLNYVQTEEADFHQAWGDYMAFVREMNPGKYQVRSLTEDSVESYNFIRSAEGSYSVGGAYTKVYHVFVRIN